MKKIFIALSVMALGLMAASCEKPKEVQPIYINVQLTCEGADFRVAGIKISLSDAAGSYTLEGNSTADGIATFSVKPGSYKASASYLTSENGERLSYTGSNNNILVTESTVTSYKLELQKIASQQLVIKEVYSTGCPKEPSGSYSSDAYVILYNNSDIEADATNVVFGMLFPYNGHATNKYYDGDNLIYENAGWIPAASALWSFTSQVTIPAYSQIVVALFGAIDHTATIAASVDLSNAAYYWMAKNEQFKNAKYAVAETIPTSHYLSCKPFNSGNAWVFSNSAPSLFIGNMTKAEAEALATNTEGYDTTQGTGPVNQAVKFPVDKVIGCVEVFSAANLQKSKARFPKSLNDGYVAITNNKGYTVYRNVDKDATEALPENQGKLVYNYAMGTTDVEGTTDPSGIDAEASIANGAHIIYRQTNNSSNDFHQRKLSSLKK